MAGYDELDPDFAGRLRGLAGMCGIVINSGYRSVERQQQLWDDAVAKYGDPEIADNWVARPGESNHNHGRAADLGGDLKCAHANAAAFGLHFPMSHEEWHIESVGAAKDAAPGAYPHGPPDGPAKDPVANAIATFMDTVMTGGREGGTVREFEAPDIAEALREGEQATATPEPTGAPGGEPGAPGAVGGDEIDRFLAAMKMKESGGNYTIEGPMTEYGQATGAYQWLDDTWGGRGGYARAKDAPPEFQEAEARREVSALFQQYGDWRKVAMHWHGGPNQKIWGPKTQSYADDLVAAML